MATFGDVRRRTILLFALGIALPSSLLGYLAFRGIRNDQALLERERREDLRRIASVTVDAHDSGLVAVGRALDSALAKAESAGTAPLPSLSELILRHPLIEAVFRLSADGAIDEFVAPDLLFHASDERTARVDRPLAGPELTRLEAARRLELRDGSLATLEEVVDFYDRGGNANPYLDPILKPLNLSPVEKEALVAFLRALTGQIQEGR